VQATGSLRAAFDLKPGTTALAVWGFESGFEAGKLAVIGEQDILGDRLVRSKRSSRRAQDFLSEVTGLSHGDLYAHNTLWDGTTGQAVLSDLGGAAFLPDGPGDPLERLDVLAFGRLMGELLDRCDGDVPEALQALRIVA